MRERLLRSREEEEPPIILVANNIEQEEQRQVSEEDGCELAKQWGDYSSYLEISTKERINCEECIEECVRLLTKRYYQDPRYVHERDQNQACCCVL